MGFKNIFDTVVAVSDYIGNFYYTFPTNKNALESLFRFNDLDIDIVPYRYDLRKSIRQLAVKYKLNHNFHDFNKFILFGFHYIEYNDYLIPDTNYQVHSRYGSTPLFIEYLIIMNTDSDLILNTIFKYIFDCYQILLKNSWELKDIIKELRHGSVEFVLTYIIDYQLLNWIEFLRIKEHCSRTELLFKVVHFKKDYIFLEDKRIKLFLIFNLVNILYENYFDLIDITEILVPSIKVSENPKTKTVHLVTDIDKYSLNRKKISCLLFLLENVLLNKLLENNEEKQYIKDDNCSIEIEWNKISKMNGLEFESYIAKLLEKNKFTNVLVTKASNDYGVDILATKDNIKYAIQAKHYSSPLGNSPIQEAVAGKEYYDCHVAVVVTNSTFTKNAKILAEKNNVLLWDKDTLLEFIKNALE